VNNLDVNSRDWGRRWTMAILVAIVFWLAQSPVVSAEGIISYGGFGADYPACGANALPCATYDYAHLQACNASENEQDTYHVYHVLDGFVSTCDMLGGTGREPAGIQRRNWGAFFLSLTLPLLAVSALSFAASVLYHRRLSAYR
jgi:hypothetical protein